MRVTESEIKQINELYLQYGTYAAVAREVGRAPSTVKRYVDPNYQSTTPKVEENKEIDWEPLIIAKAFSIFNLEWEEGHSYEGVLY